MMNYQGPSPLQELSDSVEAQPVHHTGPGGPRERLMKGVESQKQLRSQINPMAKGATGALSTIGSRLNKLQGIITDMDIVHMLKAKGMDDNAIRQLMGQSSAAYEDALGQPGSPEAVENEAAQKGFSLGPSSFEALEQDIKGRNSGMTKPRF